MTKRKEENYKFELLSKYFYVDKNSDNEWRLHHLIDRGTAMAGDLADRSVSSGYRVCNLPKPFGRIVAAPAIWVLVNKTDLPEGHPIDHGDRDRLNNDPENLSPKIHQANCVNRKTSDNHFIGIFENKNASLGSKRFQAVATDPKTKKRHSLKCHYTAEEAARAYDEFVIKKHGINAVTNASLGRL